MRFGHLSIASFDRRNCPKIFIPFNCGFVRVFSKNWPYLVPIEVILGQIGVILLAYFWAAWGKSWKVGERMSKTDQPARTKIPTMFKSTTFLVVWSIQQVRGSLIQPLNLVLVANSRWELTLTGTEALYTAVDVSQNSVVQFFVILVPIINLFQYNMINIIICFIIHLVISKYCLYRGWCSSTWVKYH